MERIFKKDLREGFFFKMKTVAGGRIWVWRE
jgi:hypothetical protein